MTRFSRNPIPYLLAAMLGAIIAFVSGVTAFDQPPLAYPDEPFLIDSPVRQGGPIVVTIPRCNTTDHDLHTTSTRVLVNVDTGERWGTGGGMPIGNINMTPGCEVVRATLYILPPWLLPGRYQLETTSTVQGRIRTFQVSHSSTVFEVVP